MPGRESAGVVLITGCSSGIGRATAERFAERGWTVFASMRSPARPEGDSLRAEASARGFRLHVPELDVGDPASIDAAVADLLRRTEGRLDVLVHNAGVLLSGPLEETTTEQLRDQLDTQVVGVHRLTRAVLPAMRKRGAGRIVFVTSAVGRVALPGLGAYAAGKWALEGMAEAWRYELEPFGIGVAIVEPGPIATSLHRNERRAASGPRADSPYAALMEAYERRVRIVRRASVERVVRTIEAAATATRPKERWPVGPWSTLGCRVGPAVPSWLRRAIVRFVFRSGKRNERENSAEA